MSAHWKPKAVAWLYSFIYKLAVTDLIGILEFYREIVRPIILQFLLFYQIWETNHVSPVAGHVPLRLIRHCAKNTGSFILSIWLILHWAPDDVSNAIGRIVTREHKVLLLHACEDCLISGIIIEPQQFALPLVLGVGAVVLGAVPPHRLQQTFAPGPS